MIMPLHKKKNKFVSFSSAILFNSYHFLQGFLARKSHHSKFVYMFSKQKSTITAFYSIIRVVKLYRNNDNISTLPCLIGLVHFELAMNKPKSNRFL